MYFFILLGKDKHINSKYTNMLMDIHYKNIKFMTLITKSGGEVKM